jgi:hypothetical protein
VINALTLTANAVTVSDYPYVWGGGHAEAGVASVGSRGPGHNGRRVGFDCSGAVAAVLAGAGLWSAGSSVPADNGVIGQLLLEKLIARGPGVAPDEVSLYDDPGVHIFMNIDGRFFGTSDGGGGNPNQSKGGAGWISDDAPDAFSKTYKQYHVLPAVLKDSTTYGHSLTFPFGAGPTGSTTVAAGVEPGDNVKVSYQSVAGGMSALSIAWVGALTADGTITSIAADGSSFTVETSAGATMTFAVRPGAGLTGTLTLGDTADVNFTKAARVLTAHAVTVTSTPTVTDDTGTIAAIATDLSSFTIQTSSGESLTFSTAGDPGLISGFQVGDDVDVAYSQDAAGTLTATQVTGVAPGSGGASGSSSPGSAGGTPGGSASPVGSGGSGTVNGSGAGYGGAPGGVPGSGFGGGPSAGGAYQGGYGGVELGS